MTYTINDVRHIIPSNLPASTINAVEKYLNTGVIPPADPCQSCEPNHVRKLISLIQVAEKNGLFPPKREAKPLVLDESTPDTAGEPVDSGEAEEKPKARKRKAKTEDEDAEAQE